MKVGFFQFGVRQSQGSHINHHICCHVAWCLNVTSWNSGAISKKKYVIFGVSVLCMCVCRNHSKKGIWPESWVPRIQSMIYPTRLTTSTMLKRPKRPVTFWSNSFLRFPQPTNSGCWFWIWALTRRHPGGSVHIAFWHSRMYNDYDYIIIQTKSNKHKQTQIWSILTFQFASTWHIHTANNSWWRILGYHCYQFPPIYFIKYWSGLVSFRLVNYKTGINFSRTVSMAALRKMLHWNRTCGSTT